MEVSRLKIATIFSGIGAPEQAAKRVFENIDIIFACEYDKFARKSYLENYDIDPSCFYNDIRELSAKEYKNRVDILIGGSPCQDFSIAGKGAGFNGLRGTLTAEFVRIIDEVRPPSFIFENVPGIKRAVFKKGLNAFITKLRDLGYYLHIEMANTKSYGVPQNRDRYFIVGFLDNSIYQSFSFAKPIPLVKRLKDLLEEKVDSKYYLKEKTLKGFKAHNARHLNKGNGFKFTPTIGGGCGNVLKHQSRKQTNRQLYIKGYP